ncbi:hypothetical protein ACFO25_11510 [Paenactinomyces guangxiensis]|uniref:Uncharacterized protein n=1 Tax=Paenactinomyces guangxiensis TaxID=1490290 RepID=A0A7W2A9H3_9BACL|nr:hypothetical protein [Paenactinomyces guangxiensis]MBA4495725.1 hypothetical protein [Paenactinomyces guangxiensis]MBH8592714.1 hypothetical protein [Paenactinomyces guangxiensis]
MALELDTRSNELGEILKVVDESVRLLNHFSDEKGLGVVETISEKVEWSLERLLARNLIKKHSQLHEVVYYLDLACFSLLRMNGESFHIYLQEVNQRYRVLLRVLYISYRHGEKV